MSSGPLRWDCSQWRKHKLTIDSFWQMVWEEASLDSQQFGPERAEMQDGPPRTLRYGLNGWAQRLGSNTNGHPERGQRGRGLAPLWAGGQWTLHPSCWPLQFYLIKEPFQQSRPSVSATMWAGKLGHTNGSASLLLQRQIFRYSNNIEKNASIVLLLLVLKDASFLQL